MWIKSIKKVFYLRIKNIKAIIYIAEALKNITKLI
jgi:hypothetical protein